MSRRAVRILSIVAFVVAWDVASLLTDANSRGRWWAIVVLAVLLFIVLFLTRKKRDPGRPQRPQRLSATGISVPEGFDRGLRG